MNIELTKVNAGNSSKEQLKTSQDTLNDGDVKLDHVTIDKAHTDGLGKIVSNVHRLFSLKFLQSKKWGCQIKTLIKKKTDPIIKWNI